MSAFLACLAILALVLTGHAGNTSPSITDNDLLAQVLQRHYQDGGYTVVDPKTSLDLGFTGETPAETANTKELIRRAFGVKGCDVGPLLDMLLEKNKTQVSLSLVSSPGDGYLVEYDGRFQKHFAKDGGGWEAWYRDNPTAHGHTRVSLPVYDANTGMVLVYIGTQTHWLAGAGYLVAYKLVDGHVVELCRIMLWIS